MIKGPRADVPPGEEERFREYAERAKQVHAEQEARRARAEQAEVEVELPLKEAEERRAARAAHARRQRVFAGSVVVVVLAAIAVAIWWTRPVMQARVQDAAQVEWAARAGLPLEATNSVGMRLRLIPPGTFIMGSPREEWGHRDDEGQRPVRIGTPLYMAATEVTQGVYEQVMGTNPSFFAGSSDMPVEYVLWDDAVRFCNELSRREGLALVYEEAGSGWLCQAQREGYRLPFEAEWEYACRAGTGEALYTGPLTEDEATLRNLWRAAWYVGNAGGRPRPVGRREPNPWGLYDMLGNVGEWCWDWYSARAAPSVDQLFGVHENEGKVVRGGSWYSDPARCRAAYRRRWPPDLPWNSAGFRVVRTVNIANIGE
ncbi:MAG: formylglycine-generating enzyme family protein [Kiritimatiellae bacterium]|nr:formylglycine-generating enzyme family protein [Kiritimatiellia bacterium]